MLGYPVPEFGVALYYPYIHFQDPNWLKIASLYWDRVRKIVPSNVHTLDSDEIKMVRDAGFILNTSPEDYLQRTTQKFQDELSNVVDERGIVSATMLNLLGQTKLSRIPPVGDILNDKFEPELIESLIHRKIARPDDAKENLQLHPAIGGLYMVCLASIMSESIRAPMVTDFIEANDVAKDVSFAGKYIDAHVSSPKFHLIDIGVKAPSKRDVAKIPMPKIVEFYRTSVDERRHFREAVEKVAKGASEISDPNALQDFLAQKRAEINEATTERERQLKSLRLETFGAALRIGIPSAIESAMSFANGMPELAAAVGIAGLTFSIKEWQYRYSEQKRLLNKDNPWHYAFNLQSFSRSNQPKGSLFRRG